MSTNGKYTLEVGSYYRWKSFGNLVTHRVSDKQIVRHDSEWGNGPCFLVVKNKNTTAFQYEILLNDVLYFLTPERNDEFWDRYEKVC